MGLLGWLVAVAAALLLAFWIGPRLIVPVRRLLAPTWLPLLILGFAVYALFVNDQGRDLGVALLGSGQGKMAVLALALLYWATGTWHTARLGLNRKFGSRPEAWPTDYAGWLRWLPRLLGACAHLFAALSLALAARHQIEPGATILGLVPTWPLVFVAPLAIVAGTVILWFQDRRYQAVRNARAADGEDPNLRPAVRAAAQRLRRAVWLVAAGAVVLVGMLLAIRKALPAGLAVATLYVLGSAVVFLLIVSFRREVGHWLLARAPAGLASRLKAAFKAEDHAHAASSLVLAGTLAAIGLACIVWAWIDPLGFGDATGSMVVGFLAFGVCIALIDLVRLLCEWHYPPTREDKRRSARVFARVVLMLVVLATATSAFRTFHRVRLCGGTLAPCQMPGNPLPAQRNQADPWLDNRLTVAEAAKAWLTQAEKDRGDTPIPLLIVATAGGGIRAAQWTATVLKELESQLGAETVRKHLFAISGVSGGSVGAAFYMASLADSSIVPTEALQHDFLASALAAMAFIDTPSSFLPEIGQADRGYALERSFEAASNGMLGRPFLSFFPTYNELESVTGGELPWRPALLLNGTHQKTGRRIIASHLKAQRHVFLDAFDANVLLNADMPASTAAHNSARFTYVSPAGQLVRPASGSEPTEYLGYVLDGGYFEVFGAITALQLVREVQDTLKDRSDVRPIILQISSDPSLPERDRSRLDQEAKLCMPSPDAEFLTFETSDGSDALTFLNELYAPLVGVLGSRSAHGILAAQELGRAICVEQLRYPVTPVSTVASASPATALVDPLLAPATGAPKLRPPPEFVHMAMCKEDGGAPPPPIPPLGWSLSKLVNGQFPQLLERCGNQAELKRLVAAMRPPD